MREFNPNGPVDLASGLQQKVNQDLQSLRTYNSRANQVDAQAAQVAEQPMQLVNAALGFSKTLFDRNQKNKEEREKKQMAAFDLNLKKNGITTEGYDNYVKFKEEAHKDQAKLEEFVKKNYSEEQAKFLRGLGKGRILIGNKLVAQKNAASMPLAWADFQRTPVTLSDGRVVNWSGTESADDQQEYYDAFVIKQIADGKLDASEELYEETYKPAFDSLYNTAVSVKSQQKVAAYDKEYEAENQEFIFNAVNNVNGDVGVQDFMGIITEQLPSYGGDLGKTFDGVYDKYVMPMVENDQVTRDQFYNFISGVMNHKGMGNVAMEKGMGKKLHLHEINKQFNKNELARLQASQEAKKAKQIAAENVAVDNLVPGLADGSYGIEDIISAEGELYQKFGYESTKLANLKKGYEMKAPEIAQLNNTFKIAEGNGTLTVEMVENTGNALLKKNWLEKAQKSEKARKGEQYKLQKKNVGNIVQTKFGKLLDAAQSPQGGEVQGYLNKLFESKVNKYIEEFPDNVDAAVNKAAVETINYFNTEQKEGGLFEVDKMEGVQTGGNIFPNFREAEEARIKKLQVENKKAALGPFHTELISTGIKIKNAGNELPLALDTPMVFLNQSQLNDAISQISDGEMTEWLTTLSSKYNLDPFEIIKRQGIAMGFDPEDLPTRPDYLEAINTNASPNLVCLMRKVGIQNLPEHTAKRLCLSMSPDGINDKELVKEIYGDQSIVRLNSEE